MYLRVFEFVVTPAIFEGAALTLEETGADVKSDDTLNLVVFQHAYFCTKGFSGGFRPVFYFLLLGPFWAVAYRLIQLCHNDRRASFDFLCHLADWLPSRVLLLTFAIVGGLWND